jgi:hypothetical protein
MTTILIWLLRKMHLRSQWFVTSIGLLLAWVATYLLRDRLPIELEFSIWEPQTLFSTPLLFSLDGITWPLWMACLAILLVISLTLPSRSVVIPIRERLTSLIYLCFTSAAVLAGNILTVLITWMLMDVFILSLGLRDTNHDEGGAEIIKWFGKNLISIFLLLIAAVFDLSRGGSPRFFDQMMGTSVVIVILSSLLRMPIHSISSYGKKIGWSDSGMISTLSIFPALSGFSVLGHVLASGIKTDAILWGRIIGGFCLTFSMIQFFLRIRKNHSTINLYLGVFGVGVLAASYGSMEAGILISVLGVLVISLNASLNYLPIHENWHTVIPILFIGMLAGLPGTLGGELGSKTANEIINSGAIGIALLVWFGMGILSGNILKRAVLVPQDWQNSENLTRISYALGLIFLVVNAVIIGIETNQDVTLKGLIFFLSTAFLASLVYYGMTRLERKLTKVIYVRLRIPQIKNWGNSILAVGQIPLRILSGIGSIFESETGMLWAFIILQFIILALGKLGL